MKIYYTGSTQGNGVKSPDRSLGGYRSQFTVQNGERGSLFVDASYMEVSEKLRSASAFMILNNESEPIDISISIDKPENSLFDYSFGVESPSSVSGSPRMQSIESRRALPYDVDFTQDDSALAVEGVPPGGHVGLWIVRKFKAGGINLFSSDISSGIEEEVRLTVDKITEE